MLHHQNLLEMEKAQHFAEEALHVAERLGDAARLVGGHMALGVTLFVQGKLEPALAHFRRGFEIFDPNMQFPNWPGSDPGVQCQFWSALISWMLGYPDRSLDELRAAVGSAETLGHPFTLAQTLCYVAFVHIFRHEPSAAADYAERALRICEERRIQNYHGLALGAHGWALGAAGESEKGLAQIGQGVNGYGLGASQHWLLTLQADAQLAIGKPEAALASVADPRRRRACPRPLVPFNWNYFGVSYQRIRAVQCPLALWLKGFGCGTAGCNFAPRSSSALTSATPNDRSESAASRSSRSLRGAPSFKAAAAASTARRSKLVDEDSRLTA